EDCRAVHECDRLAVRRNDRITFGAGTCGDLLQRTAQVDGPDLVLLVVAPVRREYDLPRIREPRWLAIIERAARQCLQSFAAGPHDPDRVIAFGRIILECDPLTVGRPRRLRYLHAEWCDLRRLTTRGRHDPQPTLYRHRKQRATRGRHRCYVR